MHQLKWCTTLEGRLVVGRIECTGDVSNDLEHGLERNRVRLIPKVRDEGLAVDPLQVLHDHRTMALEHRQILHPNDVPVAQPSEHAGLVASPLDDLFLLSPLAQQQLDGHHRGEVVSGDHLGQVDLAEASRSQFLDEPELAPGSHLLVPARIPEI